MKTHIVYKYRAPGSGPDQDDEITTETMPFEPERVFKRLQSEGQAISLWCDYQGKYGSQPKNYKVVERYIEPGTINKLNVIVTDPGSEQMPYGVEASPLARTPAPSEPLEYNPSDSWKRDDSPPEHEKPTEHHLWDPPGLPELEPTRVASPEPSGESVGHSERNGGCPDPGPDQDQQKPSWWKRFLGIE
jgi:hypothetical protein